MKLHYIKLLSLLIVSSALFAACGGDPNIETAKLNLQNEDYDGVIEAARLALDENPENADAYYYTGAAYLAKADDKPLAERREFLKLARENMVKADELYRAQDITSNEAEAAIPLILSRWERTYTEAINLINFDGENEPEDLERSINLLHNAKALTPDSVMNYDALSEVYFISDNIDKATEYMLEAIDMAEKPEPSRYQRIVHFYNVSEQPEKSLEILLDARDRFPEEIFFVQEIANAYFRKGETDTAIEVLQDLIDMDPQNAEYRLVYGSQIYQQYLNMNTEVNQMYERIFEANSEYRTEARKANADMNKLRSLEQEMDELKESIIEMDDARFQIADQAEEQLEVSYELDPTNPSTTYTLGAINENKGIALIDQRNLEDDMDKVNELDQRAREYFERSLPFYEKTAELEDDPDNWLKLFQIYVRLGMNEEAEYAQERAGI